MELHFSPGVNCCVQKNLPPGPGFRPHSRNDQTKHLSSIEQEDSHADDNSSSLISIRSVIIEIYKTHDFSAILVLI